MVEMLFVVISASVASINLFVTKNEYVFLDSSCSVLHSKIVFHFFPTPKLNASLQVLSYT